MTDKDEQNLLDWPDFAAKYGLHESERSVADVYLPNRQLQHGTIYFIDREPTPEQRQQIAHDTTMTKAEACAYLGIRADEFDRLKEEKGLNDVGALRTDEAGEAYIPDVPQYRKSDIDQLME